eukprot:gene9221-16365_t
MNDGKLPTLDPPAIHLLGTGQRVVTTYVDAQGIGHTVNSLKQNWLHDTEFIETGASAFDSLGTDLTPTLTIQLYITSPSSPSTPTIASSTSSSSLSSPSELNGFQEEADLMTLPSLPPGSVATIVYRAVDSAGQSAYALRVLTISCEQGLVACEDPPWGDAPACVESAICSGSIPGTPSLTLVTANLGDISFLSVGLSLCGIDTRKPGSYPITFLVSTSRGVQATVVRNVVVASACSFGTQASPGGDMEGCDAMDADPMSGEALLDSLFAPVAAPQPKISLIETSSLGALVEIKKVLACPPEDCWMFGCSGYEYAKVGLAPCDLSTAIAQAEIGDTLNVHFVVYGDAWPPKAESVDRLLVVVNGCSALEIYLCDGVCSERLKLSEPVLAGVNNPLTELGLALSDLTLTMAEIEVSCATLALLPQTKISPATTKPPTIVRRFWEALEAYVDPLSPVDPDRFIPSCDPISVGDGTCLPGSYNLSFSVWDKDMRGASMYQLAVVEGRIEMELWVQVPYACDSGTGTAGIGVGSGAGSLPSLQQLQGSLPSNHSFLEDLVFVVLPTLGLDPLAVRWGQLTAVSVESQPADATVCLVNASLVLELGCVPHISISSDTVIQHCPCLVLSNPSSGGGLARASAATACTSTTPQVEKGDLISSEVMALVQNSAILNLQIQLFLNSLTDSIGKLDDFAEQFADLLAYQRMVAAIVMEESLQAALLCKHFGGECEGGLTFSSLSDQLGGDMPTSFTAALTSLFQGDPEAASCSNQRLPQAMFSFVLPSLEGNATTSNASNPEGRRRRLDTTNTWAGYSMDAVKELVKQGYPVSNPKGLAAEGIPPRRVVGASNNQIIGGLFLHQTRRAMDSSAEFAANPWGTCSGRARFAKAYTTACQVKDAGDGDGLEKGMVRGRGVDPTMQPKSSIFHTGAYNQPEEWYNMTTPNPLVSNYGTVWGFEMIPLQGLPDGFPFVMTVDVKENRFKQMMVYLKDGRYLDAKDTSSLKVQVATFNTEIRAYGLFQAMVNWGINGAITAKFTSVSLSYHSFTSADRDMGHTNLSFVCDVLVILAIAAFSMFWLLEASHIIAIWWKLAMLKLKPESDTSPNGGDSKSDRALSGWGNLTSQKALDPLKDAAKGMSSKGTGANGCSANATEVDGSALHTKIICSAYASMVDGSAHATEVDGSALDTEMTCSAYADEVDGSALDTGMTCSAHATEVDGSAHATAVGCSAHASELDCSSRTTEVDCSAHATRVCRSGGSSSSDNDSHNPSLRSRSQAVGEGVESDDVLPFMMFRGRHVSATSLGHGVAEGGESDVQPGGLSRYLVGMMSCGRQNSGAIREHTVTEGVESKVKPGGLSRSLLGMMSRGRQNSGASRGDTLSDGVESEVKPGGLSRSLFGMMSRGRQNSGASREDTLSDGVESEVKPGGLSRSLFGMMSRGRQNSGASREDTLSDGVESEVKPGGSSRSLFGMMSFGRSFRSTPKGLSQTLDALRKQPSDQRRDLSNTFTSQGASSLRSIDITLTDSSQEVIPLSKDKALTDSVTEPDFSPNLSVDGSKVTWFIYDLCIILFMIGALVMLMLYLAHFKSDSLPMEGAFNVYDGDQHAPSHYLMLKRKVDATVNLLNSAADVPSPGQPLRWNLPEDRSGIEGMNAMYQYLEKASDTWLIYTLLQCIVLLLLLIRIISLLVFYPTLAVIPFTLIQAAPDLLHLALALIVDLEKSVYVTTSSIMDLEKSVYVTTSSIVEVDAVNLFQSCYLYLEKSSSTAARYTVPAVAYAGSLFLVVIANSFILAILSTVFKVLKAVTIAQAWSYTTLTSEAAQQVHWRLQSLFYGAPSNDQIKEMIDGIFAARARTRFRAGISSILALRKLTAVISDKGDHQGTGEPINGLSAAHPQQSSAPFVGGSGGESGQGDGTRKVAATPTDDSRLGKSKSALTCAPSGWVKRNSKEREVDPKVRRAVSFHSLMLDPTWPLTQLRVEASGSLAKMLAPNTTEPTPNQHPTTDRSTPKKLASNTTEPTPNQHPTTDRSPPKKQASKVSWNQPRASSLTLEDYQEGEDEDVFDLSEKLRPWASTSQVSELATQVSLGRGAQLHSSMSTTSFGRSLSRKISRISESQFQPSFSSMLSVKSSGLSMSHVNTSMAFQKAIETRGGGGPDPAQILPTRPESKRSSKGEGTGKRLRHAWQMVSHFETGGKSFNAGRSFKKSTTRKREPPCLQAELLSPISLVIPIRPFLLTSMDNYFKTDILQSGSGSPPDGSLREGQGYVSIRDQSLSQGPGSASFQYRIQSQNPCSASFGDQSLSQGPTSGSFRDKSLGRDTRSVSFRGQGLSQGPGSASLQDRIRSRSPRSASFGDQSLSQGPSSGSFRDKSLGRDPRSTSFGHQSLIQGPGSASLQDRIQSRNPRSASFGDQSLSQGPSSGSFQDKSLGRDPRSASFGDQSLSQGPGSASLQHGIQSRNPCSASLGDQSLSQGPSSGSFRDKSLGRDPRSVSFRGQSLSQHPGSASLQDLIPIQGGAELQDDEVNPPRGAILEHTNSLRSGRSILGRKAGVEQGSGSMWNGSQRAGNRSFGSSPQDDQISLVPTQTGNTSTLETLRGCQANKAAPTSDSMCTSSAAPPTQHPGPIMSSPSRLKNRTVPQEPEPIEKPLISKVDTGMDEDDPESAFALFARQDTLKGILQGIAAQQMRRAENRRAWSQRPVRAKSSASLLDSRSDSVTAFSVKDGDASTNASGIRPQLPFMADTASSMRRLGSKKTTQEVASLGRLPSLVSKTRQLPRQNTTSIGGNSFIRGHASPSLGQLSADAISARFKTGKVASSALQYDGTEEDEIPIQIKTSLLKNPLRAGSPQGQATPAHLTENFELATHKSMSSGHGMPGTAAHTSDPDSDRASRPSMDRPQSQSVSFHRRPWHGLPVRSSHDRDRISCLSTGRSQLRGVSIERRTAVRSSVDERTSSMRSGIPSRGIRNAWRMAQLTSITEVKGYENFLELPTSANQSAAKAAGKWGQATPNDSSLVSKAVSSVVQLTTSAIELMQDLQPAFLPPLLPPCSNMCTPRASAPAV